MKRRRLSGSKYIRPRSSISKFKINDLPNSARNACSVYKLGGLVRFIDVYPAAGAALLIFIFTLVRLLLMSTLGFGVDEAYTLAHVQSLQWSYFDHPPLHIWIAHYSSQLLGSGSLVRLPFIALFAGTSWLCFVLTRYLFGPQAGFWAVLSLNASAFFTLSAGSWVVPDGPLLFCLAAAGASIAHVLFPKYSSSEPTFKHWLIIGMWLGLAGLSKYNAILFPIGLLFFLLQSPRHRHWLRRPSPYIGAAVAFAIILPVFIWNYRNGWVSFQFQGERGVFTGRINFGHVVGMIGGQIALLLPWIFLPLVIALVREGRSSRADSPARLLLYLTLPPILTFTIVPLWGARGLPHWPMPGWFFAFPLLGAWLATKSRSFAGLNRWAYGSVAGLLGLLAVGVAQADTGLIELAAPDLGRYGDPTLESLSWAPLYHSRFTGVGNVAPPAFVVARNWIAGGKIDQELKGRLPVLVFSDDPRGFAFEHNSSEFLGRNGLIVVEQKHADEFIKILEPFFEKLGSPEIVSIGRSGMKEINLSLIPAINLIAEYPLPYGKKSAISMSQPSDASGK